MAQPNKKKKAGATGAGQWRFDLFCPSVCSLFIKWTRQDWARFLFVTSRGYEWDENGRKAGDDVLRACVSAYAV
jgi:hypothetical protein